MQTGQDGEDRFLTLFNLLVEHIVGLIELGESRCAVDDGDGIDIVELVFTIVNHRAQLLSRSCSKEVDGVGYR